MASGGLTEQDIVKPDILKFHVESRIRHRYARTLITSIVANNAAKAQEVLFQVTLPQSAFISAFQMEIDGKVYKAHVKEKEEAKQEYMAAVALGQSAAHVEQNVRDSNKFTVSLNVEKTKTVTFKLTHEELLKRELSAYKHVINIDPGQVVPELLVEVFIEESSDITLLEVPPLKETSELQQESLTQADVVVDALAKIERPKPSEGVVRWSPSIEEQKKCGANGVRGQLLIRYDVDRKSHPEQILINNGYFVHFFAPSDLPVLRKHVVFVLDISGSMQGRKIEQMKDAMKTILNNINSDDFFSLVLFSTDVRVWDPNVVEPLLRPESENRFVPRPVEELPEAVVVSATASNIEKAKLFVSCLHDESATNIHGALLRAIEVAHLGKKLHKLEKISGPRPEPMIIFLTDGQPNVGESHPDNITNLTTVANKDAGAAIFSLAFGDDADMEFLKKLSLQNSGFARKIYEAADAALQLNHFYRLVASPLLANVQFKYEDKEVVPGSVTNTTFRTLFDGSELVVAGRLHSDAITGEMVSNSFGVQKTSCICKPTVMPKREHDFMERLWAFLTVQQLLDNITAEADVAENKKQALALALKYSFVTPLTSLVVVKPDESTEATNTEKADVENPVDGAVFRLHKRNMKVMPSSLAGVPCSAPIPGITNTRKFQVGIGGTSFGCMAPHSYQSTQQSFGMAQPFGSMAPQCFQSTPLSFGMAQKHSLQIQHQSASTQPRWFKDSKQELDEPMQGTYLQSSEIDAGLGVADCKVSSLLVKSNIWCRYASTIMEQVFVNHGSTTEEMNFNIYLTLSAVISHCSLCVDGKVKTLQLLSIKDGELNFNTSKSSDKASVLVRPSTSDGQRGVTVHVVVPRQTTVAVKFQYEEFLEDFGDGYLYTFTLNPEHTVPDLQISVNVEGFYKLADVRALHIIPFSPKEEVLDQVEVKLGPAGDHRKAMLTWSPSVEEQAKLFGPDHTMQLGVEYKAKEPNFESDGPNGEVVLDESGQIIHMHLPVAKAGDAAEAVKQHVILVLHIGSTATAEMREHVTVAARNLLLKLHEKDLFSIVVCTNDIQVWEDSGSVLSGTTTLGTDRFPASQANVTKARDFITQALATVPPKDPSVEAALTKALQISTQTEQGRPVIFVLSSGGTSNSEAEMLGISSKLKKANTNRAVIFSLACGSASLLALFRDIAAYSSGFACELHKQTVERLLDMFHRISEFDKISCKVVSELPVFSGFMEKFWLKEDIEQSAGDIRLKLSLKHNIATCETSFFGSSE